MGDIKKVPIKIGNREYHVSCTEDEEYIRKIEYYLDKRLKMVLSSSPSLDIMDATNLVALNLADELFKAVKSLDKISGKAGMKVDFSNYADIEKIQKEGIPSDGIVSNE